MGTSTNAILFYGLCWQDETSRPWTIDEDDDGDSEDGWEERYAAAVGVLPPEEPFPNGTSCTPTKENRYQSYQHTTADQPVLDKYHAYWAAKRAAAAAAGVEVGCHCSGDCPMPYVAVSKSEVTVHLGDDHVLAPGALEVDPAWDGLIADFCQKLGIKTTQKPAWHLVSYWS